MRRLIPSPIRPFRREALFRDAILGACWALAVAGFLLTAH